MPGKGDRGRVKEKPKDARGALRRIIRYLMQYKYLVLLFLILAFLSNLGNLMGPSFAGKAIDAISAGEGRVNMAAVTHFALLMLGFYVGSSLLSFLVTVGMMRVGRKVAQNMRRDVFNKLMRLPVSYFDRHQTGDIISRVSYDIDVATLSLSTDVIHIVTSTVTVVGSLVMMCSISLPLVLCMIFTIPLSVLFTRHMSRKTRPLYAKRSASYGRMNGFTEEMFSGQKTILAYAHEGEVCDKFSGINRAAAVFEA